MGLDIAEINNLMETGLRGQKSARLFIRRLISPFLICTQPDKMGEEKFCWGSNGCSAHEWALPNEAALQSHQHSHSHSLTQFVTGWQLQHHCRHRKADKGSVGRLRPIQIFRLSAINPIS